MKYLLFLFPLLFLGCGTVSPNYPTAKEIAYGTDGLHDAGVKGQVIDMKTGTHMILLQSADRDEFNNDVIKYGNLFNPPLIKDQGILPYKDKYAFRNDTLVNLSVMKNFEEMDLGKR